MLLPHIVANCLVREARQRIILCLRNSPLKNYSNRLVKNVCTTICLFCRSQSKLHTTIGRKNVSLLSEETQCLSCFTEAASERKEEKNKQKNNPAARNAYLKIKTAGWTGCIFVCPHVCEKDNGLQPLKTIFINLLHTLSLLSGDWVDRWPPVWDVCSLPQRSHDCMWAIHVGRRIKHLHAEAFCVHASCLTSERGHKAWLR